MTTFRDLAEADIRRFYAMYDAYFKDTHYPEANKEQVAQLDELIAQRQVLDREIWALFMAMKRRRLKS